MVVSFREETPTRRPIEKSVTRYGEYKKDLILDFKNRCGYCNTVDTWRITWYEIDHFVPKEYLNTLSEISYSNLVYSCRSCNNAKRAKWPTKDENIHNNGKEGFIDPCSDKFACYFYRTEDGCIRHNGTDLGQWMYEALKFNKPVHQVLWLIEQVSKEIDEIRNLIDTTGGISEYCTLEGTQIVKKIYELDGKYKKYTESLVSY